MTKFEGVECVPFSCQNCNSQRLEEVLDVPTIVSGVMGVFPDGRFCYSGCEKKGGEVVRYQCSECGMVVVDDDHELITDPEELLKHLSKLNSPRALSENQKKCPTCSRFMVTLPDVLREAIRTATGEERTHICVKEEFDFVTREWTHYSMEDMLKAKVRERQASWQHRNYDTRYVHAYLDVVEEHNGDGDE